MANKCNDNLYLVDEFKGKGKMVRLLCSVDKGCHRFFYLETIPEHFSEDYTGSTSLGSVRVDYINAIERVLHD